jgi:Spy/CpxP family protein refolding chaperone
MKRTLIFIVVALIAIGSAATLLAQTAEVKAPPTSGDAPGPDNPPCMMPGMKGGHMGGMMPGKMPGMMEGCGHMRGGQCGMLNCKELELTDDQVAKIKDLNFAHRNKMIDIQAAMKKAQLKMQHEMRAESPNKAAVLAAAKEVNAVRGQMAEERINHQFAMRGILTAEQLKKWDDCRGKCEGKCGMGMGPGFGQGRGSGHGDKQRKRDGSCMKGK